MYIAVVSLALFDIKSNKDIEKVFNDLALAYLLSIIFSNLEEYERFFYKKQVEPSQSLLNSFVNCGI